MKAENAGSVYGKPGGGKHVASEKTKLAVKIRTY